MFDGYETVAVLRNLCSYSGIAWSKTFIKSFNISYFLFSMEPLVDNYKTGHSVTLGRYSTKITPMLPPRY